LKHQNFSFNFRKLITDYPRDSKQSAVCKLYSQRFIHLRIFGILLLYMGVSLIGNAQEKGVSPLAVTNKSGFTGKLYAVVVGISDYQDAGIPDLRFAERDAKLFYDFLKGKAGYSLNEDQIQLLTNKEATQGKIVAALDWMMTECKEGDQAIIYFSGHGDVERKTISQPGFLLCWDAPSKVYMSGGAFALGFLEDIVNTLAIEKKVKTIVITDACHSGKLSGSAINGTQATAAYLANQFANAIKIMSCQSNEYSLEGEKWGGGRGVFSYHLIDGLVGLADRNSDGKVALGELDRYLEDNVSNDVKPNSQIPLLLGDKLAVINSVNKESLAQLKKEKDGAMVAFAPAENKGLETEVLAKASPEIQEFYKRFKARLEQKLFLSPANDCADYYYLKLEADTSIQKLHNSMRFNYAAVLQDDAQQVLNRFLNSDLGVLTQSKLDALKKFQRYPEYLERAATLLGREHYMYPVLQARKLFFEGFFVAKTNRNLDKETGSKALSYLTKALQFQENMPQVYWQMSFIYGYNLLQQDSAEYYAEKAATLVPSWQLPYAGLVFLYSDKIRNYSKAKFYLDKINQIDSNSLVAHYSAGIYYETQGAFDLAAFHYKKALEIDSTFIYAQSNLGNTYYNTGKLPEAEYQYQRAIQLDASYPMAHGNIGIVYYLTKRMAQAEQSFKRALELEPKDPFFNYNIACFYYGQNESELAYQFLKKALEFGYNDYKGLQEDPSLQAVREDPVKWNALMQQFFPDKNK